VPGIVRRVLQRFAGPTLPDSPTRAVWALALFATLQLADAVMTAAGITRFGSVVEANPILQASVGAFGVGATLTIAKTVSVACATLLYLHSRYLTLALLTVVCVAAAVVPWAWLLAQ
jgi:hypothetical protein